MSVAAEIAFWSMVCAVMCGCFVLVRMNAWVKYYKQELVCFEAVNAKLEKMVDDAEASLKDVRVLREKGMQREKKLVVANDDLRASKSGVVRSYEQLSDEYATFRANVDSVSLEAKTAMEGLRDENAALKRQVENMTRREPDIENMETHIKAVESDRIKMCGERDNALNRNARLEIDNETLARANRELEKHKNSADSEAAVILGKIRRLVDRY